MKLMVHPYKVWLHVETDRDRAQMLIDKYDLGAIPEGACGSAHATADVGRVLVYMQNPSLGVLVHELFHAVMWIGESRGLNPYDSYSEPLAYMLEDLFNRTKHLVVQRE